MSIVDRRDSTLTCTGVEIGIALVVTVSKRFHDSIDLLGFTGKNECHQIPSKHPRRRRRRRHLHYEHATLTEVLRRDPWRTDRIAARTVSRLEDEIHL